jgi:eukaryotic-like serine/threonine-protein kinase
MAGDASQSRFEVIRKIARGGMGEVYLARQVGIEGFSKDVVLKRIHASLADDPTLTTMFLEEARIAALLDHPNIVQIYGLGRQDNHYFIVMEYVPGLSLSRLIKKLEAPLPLNLAIQIAAEVAAGLQFAHDKRDEHGEPLNLVHRDVSPPNILLSTSGSVKITDFGIAKVKWSSSHTRAGVVKGKYSYLTPEQVRGETADRRSDLYSLGLILYEITTGQRAYPSGKDTDILRAIASGRFRPPEEVLPGYPQDLRDVLMKALATERAERFPECQEFQDALLGLLLNRGVTTSPAKLGQQVQEWMEGEEGEEAHKPAPLRKSLSIVTSAREPDESALPSGGTGSAEPEPVRDRSPFEESVDPSNLSFPIGSPELGQGAAFVLDAVDVEPAEEEPPPLRRSVSYAKTIPFDGFLVAPGGLVASSTDGRGSLLSSAQTNADLIIGPDPSLSFLETGSLDTREPGPGAVALEVPSSVAEFPKEGPEAAAASTVDGVGSVTSAVGEMAPKPGRRGALAIVPFVFAGVVLLGLGGGVSWYVLSRDEGPAAKGSGSPGSASGTGSKAGSRPPAHPSGSGSAKGAGSRATTAAVLEGGAPRHASTKAAVPDSAPIVPRDAGAATAKKGHGKDTVERLSPPGGHSGKTNKTSKTSKISKTDKIHKTAKTGTKKGGGGGRPPTKTAKGPKTPTGPVTLTVTTDPVADVYLGKKLLGRTPLTTRVPKGELQLTLRNAKLGLEAARKLSPPSGTSLSARFVFNQGWIGIRAKAGLRVLLDGKERGQTPIAPLPAYEGQHAVVLEDGSGPKQKQAVTVKPTQTVWVKAP